MMPLRSKFVRIYLVLALIGLAVGAVLIYRARAASAVPLETQVERHLAAGRVAEAVEAVSRAGPGATVESKAATAAVLLGWAAAHDSATAPATSPGLAADVGEAYIAALSLDVSNQNIYVEIAGFLDRHHIASVATRAATHAEGAQIGEDPDFLGTVMHIRLLADLYTAAEAADRTPPDVDAIMHAARLYLQEGLRDEASRYVAEARELAPDRLDVLNVLAALGMVEPVSATGVADIALPFVGGFLNQGNARAGRVLLTGHSDGRDVACVVAVPGGRVVATIDECNYKSAALSPTGRYVVYADNADLGEPCRVFVLDLETNSTRTLATVKGTVPGTAWSPDETHIAVASFDGLLLFGADGSGAPTVVHPADTEGENIRWSLQAYPHWLPGAGADAAGTGAPRLASQKLGWEYLGEVLIHDLAAGTSSPALTVSGAGHEIGLARWSSDGSKMAYARRSDAYWQTVIAAPGTTSGDPAPVLTAPIDVMPHEWSPDGTELLLQVENQIWLLETASARLSLLPGEPFFHITWGDDGVLYFLADEGRRLVGVRLFD